MQVQSPTGAGVTLTATVWSLINVNGHNKFWRCYIVDNPDPSVVHGAFRVLRYGRRFTNGQTRVAMLNATRGAAVADADDVAFKKHREGYDWVIDGSVLRNAVVPVPWEVEQALILDPSWDKAMYHWRTAGAASGAPPGPDAPGRQAAPAALDPFDGFRERSDGYVKILTGSTSTDALAAVDLHALRSDLDALERRYHEAAGHFEIVQSLYLSRLES